MDQDTEFLNYIYQNAEMGMKTIDCLLDKAENSEFLEEMREERSRYGKFSDKAREQLEKAGNEPEEGKIWEEQMAKMMIRMQTLADKSPSHMAEMLVQGNTMGIIDMTKKLNEYPDLAPGVRALGHALKTFSQHNIDNCKYYL